MRRTLFASLATLALLGGSCTQVQQAVQGSQSGPGGWTMVSQSRTEMTSDVQYLGASADGLLILRMADGSTQIWSTNR